MMPAGRTDSVQWTEAPPPKEPGWFPVLSPEPGKPVQGIILNSHVQGVITHFVDRRTRPCMGDREVCQGCFAAIAKRWKGYIAIFLPGAGRIALAEITVEAYRSSPELSSKHVNLRGYLLKLERQGKARNSRIIASAHPYVKDEKLPPPPDIRQALLRLWGELPPPAGQQVPDREGRDA